MGSAARGKAAEAAVLHALLKRGLEVFFPFGSSTDHGSGPRGYAGLTDLVGVYLPPSEEVSLTPIDFEIRTCIDERLTSLVAATRGAAA